MDPKRGGESSAAVAKKQSASRVKVVASRYAQVLQSKNVENHAARALTTPGALSSASRAPASSSSTPWTAAGGSRSRAHVSAGGVRTMPSVAAAQLARVKSEHRTAIPAAPTMTKRPRISTSPGAVINPASEILVAAASSNPTGQDLKERLKVFKANKSLSTEQRQPLAAPVSKSVSKSVSKPRAIVKSSTVRERPTFPKRISHGAERSTKRPAKVASQPIPVETTVFASRPAGSTTPRAKASSVSASLSSRSQPQQTDEDELELLEAMYYQLCFTEMRAERVFREQEQSAEQQILAVWSVVQSKLELLHDTSLRLDREKHVQLIEENLADQALPSVQIASRLPEFIESLNAVCGSLEASLLRLPTPGVMCKDPLELKRHIEALAAELDGLLQQVDMTNLDTKVSNAVASERGMEQTVDSLGKSLLQAANLVEDLLREVNTATSMRIQQIQHRRVTAAMDRRDGDGNGAWW